MTQVTLVGQITDALDHRTTPSGRQVVNFTVAHQDHGSRMFVRCHLWGARAAVAAQILARGVQVIIQGRLSVSSYTTQDGEKRLTLDCDADHVGLLLTAPSRSEEK